MQQIKLNLTGIDALIFDCDGTLTNSMPLHFIAWQEVTKKNGLCFDEQRFYQLAGMPTRTILQTLANEQNVDINVDQMLLEKEDIFLTHIHRLEEIPVVADIARQNHGSKKLAVASGGYRRIINQQLAVTALRDLFPVVVTAEDTARHKPEPDVFLKAAELLRVSPERCIVFEDADLGVEAARRAGMQWIDVRPYI